MGCSSSKTAVRDPVSAESQKPAPLSFPEREEGAVLPFVAGEEGSDSDRTSGARCKPKMVESSTQTIILSEELLDCNLLRNAAMAWTDNSVDLRAVKSSAPKTAAPWCFDQRGDVYMDDAIVEISPSKTAAHKSNSLSTREMFATKYRLRLELPNSVDDESADDDRTTTCSNASTDYVDDVRDAPHFNVWGTVAPGTIQDVEDEHESDTMKLSGDFLHEALSAATAKSMGGGGLQRIGNRLVWMD
eukprot:gnl/MRDRNA2_/MRDRNA2_99257_c0_seq1.p1 gnl/MRDRNA2_/MRDRNA2_99257_c0~~gnl/MRDRNA2_/MRDRNA2_99257_c0_seq1.p1  ORF type:complete len:245 (+),score=47.98 gnl/MRDRNA2_/MRDRNA2_99257_c0_seq1:69-803(+)